MVSNRNNGKLVAAIPIKEVIFIMAALKECFIAQKIASLDVFFNQLVGVNGLDFTNADYVAYKLFGNLFAYLIGIGCKSKALFNILGFLVLKQNLPANICYITASHSTLGSLIEINNCNDLQIKIYIESVLIDGYAYWQPNYIFQDGLHPAETHSCQMVSHLIGNKDLLHLIKPAIEEIISYLSESEATYILELILAAFAIDDNAGKYLSELYDTTCFVK